MSEHSDEITTDVESLTLPCLPRVKGLYVKHIGVTKALSESYEEAAAVCLCGQFVPPTQFEITWSDSVTQRFLLWRQPTDVEKRAWANNIDCVEAAAYGVALSAVEATLGLVAIERAATRSGADYYVAASQGDYLEDAVRLEISGTASSDVGRIRDRLKSKLRQVAHPSDPSLACVVSFGARMIVLMDAQACQTN